MSCILDGHGLLSKLEFLGNRQGPTFMQTARAHKLANLESSRACINAALSEPLKGQNASFTQMYILHPDVLNFQK